MKKKKKKKVRIWNLIAKMLEHFSTIKLIYICINIYYIYICEIKMRIIFMLMKNYS